MKRQIFRWSLFLSVIYLFITDISASESNTDLVQREIGNCHATYFPESGKVIIPCVDVIDATGEVQNYSAILEHLSTGGDNPWQFGLKEWSINDSQAAPLTEEALNCRATYFPEEGRLLIPCVDIIDSLGNVKSHAVSMEQSTATLVEVPKWVVTEVVSEKDIDISDIADNQSADTRPSYESEELTTGTREKATSSEDSDDMMLFGHELIVGDTGDIVPGSFGVADKEQRWKPGTILKVAFDFTKYQSYSYNGKYAITSRNRNIKPSALCKSTLTTSECEDKIIKEVIKTARMWTKSGKVNLSFQLTNNWNDAQIRFRLGTDATMAGTAGYSSVGKGSLYKGKNLATLVMNEEIRPDSSFYASVLHEFGHALALQHEHQHSKSAYQWQKTQIKETTKQWTKDGSGWTDSMIDSFIESSKTGNFDEITNFDPKSIMSYDIPSSWVSNADNRNPQKCPAQREKKGKIEYCVLPIDKPVLSSGDKETIAELYPCTYSISATKRSSSAKGGSNSVGVTTSNNCTWTASSKVKWITVTSGMSGKGESTVKYSVSPNTSSVKRIGQLAIAGKTLTITQSEK